MPGHMDDRRDFPGGFPGDARDAFDRCGRTPDEQQTFEAWRTLIHLRRSSQALRRGRMIDLGVTDTTYAYLREADGERLVVVLNSGTGAGTVRIPAQRIKGSSRLETIYGSAPARMDDQGLAVDLPGESATVLASAFGSLSWPAEAGQAFCPSSRLLRASMNRAIAEPISPEKRHASA